MTALLHIVFYQPEIPPNTGNIIRLCANMPATLHLIEPLGFQLEDKQLRRAGLDYHEWANVASYPNWENFLAAHPGARFFYCSTRGTRNYDTPQYQAGDMLVFGPETRGLPQAMLDAAPPEQIIRIPMRPDSRSLNLSNATAIIAYEAWRQMGFALPDNNP